MTPSKTLRHGFPPKPVSCGPKPIESRLPAQPSCLAHQIRLVKSSSENATKVQNLRVFSVVQSIEQTVRWNHYAFPLWIARGQRSFSRGYLPGLDLPRVAMPRQSSPRYKCRFGSSESGLRPFLTIRSSRIVNSSLKSSQCSVLFLHSSSMAVPGQYPLHMGKKRQPLQPPSSIAVRFRATYRSSPPLRTDEIHSVSVRKTHCSLYCRPVPQTTQPGVVSGSQARHTHGALNRLQSAGLPCLQRGQT